MDRAERQGLGIAVFGHIVLFAALSVSLLSPPEPLEKLNKPVDVVLVDEAALESTAPEIARSAAAPSPEPAPAPTPAPAAAPEPIIAPPPPQPRIEPTPPRPEPKVEPVPLPKPKPVAKVEPKPVPKPKPVAKVQPPKPKPQPKAAAKTPPKPVAKPKAAATPAAKPATKTAARDIKPTDRLKGLNLGTSGSGTATAKPGGSTAPKGSGSGSAGPAATGAPAAKTAAQIRTTIDVRIDGAIAPFWQRNIPTGVDVEQLVTVVEIRLNKDGTVAGARLKNQGGKTDSNTPQQALHVERAIKSIRQAAPFNLPAEYYDEWKEWDVTFRGRGRM